MNFASRIESANKNYATEMLISENVHAQVAHRITVGKRIDDVIVKGKSGQHVLYEVKGLTNRDLKSNLSRTPIRRAFRGDRRSHSHSS